MGYIRFGNYHFKTNKFEGIFLNYDQFILDSDQMTVARYNGFCINPKERLNGKLIAIVEEIENEERKLPSRFIVRLENRHSICNCRIDYVFEVMEKSFFEADIRFNEFDRERLGSKLSNEINIIFLYDGMNR